MSSNPADRWISFPAEGKALKRCRLRSSGKRGVLSFELEDGFLVELALADVVQFTRLDGVRQSFRALDDVWVELTIEPLEGKRVLIERAELHFWPEHESPDEWLARCVHQGRWTGDNLCVDVRLSLRLLD
jgi:hypothetical protein